MKKRARVSFRGGFARAYTPAETAAAESAVKIIARGLFKEPVSGAVRLEATFYLAAPKSLKISEPVPCAKKCGDVDNYLKLVMDALNGVAYSDDSQVWEVCARKMYSNVTETRVCVSWVDS